MALRGGGLKMEDEQFKESTSRHHYVTLCRLNDNGDFSSSQIVTLYSSSPSVVRSHDLNSLITRDESADDFLDGRNKHVNDILINSDYEHQPLVQTSNSPVSRYHFQRTRSPGLQVSQVSSKDRVKGGGGFGFSLTAADARMLLAGGLTTLLKIGALLLTRAFCGNLWPYLQVLSICSLSIDPLKLLVPKARKIPIAPLKGLAAPVLYITVARPIVRWGLPDAYRTAQFWRRLLPIYFGQVPKLPRSPSILFHDPTDIDLKSGEAEVPNESAAGILLPRYVIPWISANMGPADDPELLYMKTKYGTRGKSQEDKDKTWATRHEWGGDRVHRLVLDLSGFYVKSAQILATKADFVPEPWIRRLSNHLDNAPPRPFPEVEESIRQQLERCPGRSGLITDGQGLVKLNAAFAVVEEKCIAAASIAQVHGAELKDGNRVVIKVQHLGMEVIMKSDLRNIVWVAKFLEGQLPFDLGPVVREIQKTIPLEFDFEREVWFMTTIKKNLEKGGFDRIVCPEPVLDLCATRLLVMQRLEGIPFTRILHPQASAELKGRIPEVVSNVEYLVSAYGQMLLQDGVFHADPHAGNLLLLSDGRLGLIDFGQSKVLEPGLRKLLAQMIVALGNNSNEEIASALHNLGMRFENANGRDVETSTLALMARILFDTCYVHEATVSPMAEESILRRTPLTTFNQALWLVVRAMVLLRGLCYGLNMDLSSCTLWRPYALRALEEHGRDPVGGKWA